MSDVQVRTETPRITPLSSNNAAPVWALVVIAYNEEKTIAQALTSIGLATANKDIRVYVVANGCTDKTAEEVKKRAVDIDNLTLVEINVADKANAWNVFVHQVLSLETLNTLDACFFMDGDVQLLPNACVYLAQELDITPRAEAVGAMPATGRDRDSWRHRMVINSMLAGNCYALRATFLAHLKEQKMHIPVGLIGEDFFVSWLVASNKWRNKALENEWYRCAFNSKAEFSFRSLSPWRLSDWRTYIRRKWRYALREVQHTMLMQQIEQGVFYVPQHVRQLYAYAPKPRLFVYNGIINTTLHFLVARWVRKQR